MNREPRMSKILRARLARDRKRALRVRDLTFWDLAAAAGVTYSMAEKWMNARRNSEVCQAAFERMTAKAPHE